ncbi:MAG: phosphatase PAP2 family protein [Desulfobacterales bacterium]|nr:phosphatase PAP2 family protein [Desulfobacterales bacterium]MBF0399081.1 phosphatase PAP2 family protein [Desulfobacterales bacterium]
MGFIEVLINQIIALDNNIDKYFIDFQLPWLLKIMKILTHIGSALLCWILYASFFIFFNDSLGIFLITIISGEIMLLCSVIILRNITKRKRPVSEINYKNAILKWNNYSFPSLHSARMFMLTFLIAKNYHKLMLVILSIAIIISFSRIYIRKHYMSDVLIGSVIGIFSGAIAYYSF